MNEGIERAMNSENLGTRIMQNRALDQKISDLESCRGKMVCLGGSGAILKKNGVVGGSWRKRRGSCGM
jgi:hypothetical protein